MGRKKKLRKSIASFEDRIEEHEKKIELFGSENYAVKAYWETENERFRREIKKRRKKLRLDR